MKDKSKDDTDRIIKALGHLALTITSCMDRNTNAILGLRELLAKTNEEENNKVEPEEYEYIWEVHSPSGRDYRTCDFYTEEEMKEKFTERFRPNAEFLKLEDTKRRRRT